MPRYNALWSYRLNKRSPLTKRMTANSTTAPVNATKTLQILKPVAPNCNLQCIVIALEIAEFIKIDV